MICPSCHERTPTGNFCVRCGAPLDDEAMPGRPSRNRPQFAAAPNELLHAPRVISTLFPQLPRPSMADFRMVLTIGTAVVAMLAALRLFPVALIAAAMLTPLLMTLYLVDVDVYEDEPVWAMCLTLGWGAAAGVGIGVLAVALAPTNVDVVVHGGEKGWITSGVVIPLLGLGVLLAGPLVLLRYRRFNDVLDGVTFGAATAAAFVGAEAVTYSVSVLGGGVRPDGVIGPWIWRVISIGIAVPVLTMCAAAVACAALWLRYRAPLRDRKVLGASGHPAVALPLAGALVVGGAIGETFLPSGAWLGWLLTFDLVGVLLLRRAIHVGLLEESREIPIGPEITCPNCLARTARHTFCGNCGVSLQALPKARPAPDASGHAATGAEM
jgi:hypothetical protein